MKKIQKVITFLIFFLIIAPFVSAQDEEWKLVKKSDGVQIFKRPIGNSGKNEFKGVTTIDAPIGVIHDVLKDIPSFPKWFGYCKKINVIKNHSDIHKIVYLVIRATWPFTDRDLFTEVKYFINSNNILITINLIDDPKISIKTKYIRMSMLEGKCIVTSINKNETEVVYIIRSDASCNIPDYISNLFGIQQPLESLIGLREMSKKRKNFQNPKK